MSLANNLLKLVVGVILVVVAVWFTLRFPDWGKATIDVIQGWIVLLVIFIGLVFLLLGFSDLKNA